MLRYVIDAYAWIEYLIGSGPGAKVNAVLEKETNQIYTCAVTVAEVVSKVVREGREPTVAYDILVNNSQIIDVDEELSKDAGLLHAEMRKKEKDFGLADAYVLATSRKLKSKILTGDPHFKNVKDAVTLDS
jgi:predicted nucleic acid-binding protein